MKIHVNKEQFIVKVQVSLHTTDPNGAQVLVYNEDRSVWHQAPLTKEVSMLMKGLPKVYCLAHMHDTMVVLDEMTDEQDW